MRAEPFDPEKLLLHLDWAECDDLEFKSARGGFPGSLWETYSAMANILAIRAPHAIRYQRGL
jgi:hypothetical protein